MQCHRHSLAAGRGNNLYLASGKACVFKVFLSVNFDLQTAIWWSCLGGCSCNCFIKCIMKRMFTLKHPGCKNKCLLSEGNNAASLSSGIPWDECTQGISALPDSSPNSNHFSQPSNVIFFVPLERFLEFLSEIFQSPGDQGFSFRLGCGPKTLLPSSPQEISSGGTPAEPCSIDMLMSLKENFQKCWIYF